MNKFAIIGSESAMRRFKGFSVPLATEKTTPKAVAQELSLLDDKSYSIIVTGDIDAQLKLWISTQVASGIRVAIISDDKSEGQLIKGTRLVNTSSTVNDLLILFKSPIVNGGDVPFLTDDSDPFNVEQVEAAPPATSHPEPTQTEPVQPTPPLPSQSPSVVSPSTPSVARRMSGVVVRTEDQPTPVEPTPEEHSTPVAIEPPAAAETPVDEDEPFDPSIFAPTSVAVSEETSTPVEPTPEEHSTPVAIEPPAAAETPVDEDEPFDPSIFTPTAPKPAPVEPAPDAQEETPQPTFVPPPPPQFAPPPPFLKPDPPSVSRPKLEPDPDEELSRRVAQTLIDRNAGILDSDTVAPLFNIDTQQRTAKVIVTFSGKGGTGKTTTAILLAHIASALGQIERTVLVDANRGQGDVRAYLGLQGINAPSIYDLAFNGGKVQDAIISPTQMAEAARGSSIQFYTVLAPKSEDANPEIVSNALYTSVIGQLKETVDLIVIDTQTSEEVDIPAIMTKVMIPILQGNPNAYAVGVPDASKPGLENTRNIARILVNAGVKPSQIMFLFNRMAIGANQNQLQQVMRGLGDVVGVVQADNNVATRPSLVNGIDLKSPYAEALLRILYRVTENQRFAQNYTDSQADSSGVHRLMSLFKRG
jgi:Mrp family chromosome partitioning ATPase